MSDEKIKIDMRYSLAVQNPQIQLKMVVMPITWKDRVMFAFYQAKQVALIAIFLLSMSVLFG